MIMEKIFWLKFNYEKGVFIICFGRSSYKMGSFGGVLKFEEILY